MTSRRADSVEFPIVRKSLSVLPPRSNRRCRAGVLETSLLLNYPAAPMGRGRKLHLGTTVMALRKVDLLLKDGKGWHEWIQIILDFGTNVWWIEKHDHLWRLIANDLGGT